LYLLDLLLKALIERIDRIIEDVLSISRRGAGSPQALEVRPFIASVIQDVVAQTGAQAHRIETRIECEDTIWFDEGNLRQVLVNLLGNALRHASEQAGAVSLQWLVSDGAPVMLVCDDGSGVPQAHRTQLFEPFFTTDSRGTGLGLYLARELCSANGATLRYRPTGDNPSMRSAFIIEPQTIVGT
jgi:two-component system sensor histidine kinase PilS (NtrC family)